MATRNARRPESAPCRALGRAAFPPCGPAQANGHVAFFGGSAPISGGPIRNLKMVAGDGQRGTRVPVIGRTR
jgi:hypothetical protein